MWTLLSSGFISDLHFRFSYHSIVFLGVVWVYFPLWAHSHGSEWNNANPSKRENTLFSPVLRASKVDFKWRFSWFTIFLIFTWCVCVCVCLAVLIFNLLEVFLDLEIGCKNVRYSKQGRVLGRNYSIPAGQDASILYF